MNINLRHNQVITVHGDNTITGFSGDIIDAYGSGNDTISGTGMAFIAVSGNPVAEISGNNNILAGSGTFDIKGNNNLLFAGTNTSFSISQQQFGVGINTIVIGRGDHATFFDDTNTPLNVHLEPGGTIDFFDGVRSRPTMDMNVHYV